jgi:hypothetical protein
LDPRTGAIQWPPLLREPAYDEPRREVEQLFAARAKTGKGGEGTLNYLEIRTAVGRVRDQLEDRVAQIDAATWIAANQFLSRLVNKAREPPAAPKAGQPK